MKIVFNRKSLISGLIVGGGYAGSKKILPILGCAKITIRGNDCWIMSYNGKNAIKAKCPVESSEEDIVFCIDSIELRKYISLINDDLIEINIEEEKIDKYSYKGIAEIKTENGSIEFPLEDAREFPVLKIDTNTESFLFDANMLLYWIEKSKPFLLEDEFFPNKQCVHIVLSEGTAKVYASEGHNIYHDVFPEIDYKGECTLSIDKTAFDGLESALKSIKDKNVKITNSENNMMFVCGDVMVLIQKLEKKALPPFDRLINLPDKTCINVDKKALISALRRISLLSDNINSVCDVSVRDNSIYIYAENIYYNKKAEELIPFDSDGEVVPITQRFSISYLSMVVNSIMCDKVSLCFTGESTPIKIKNTEYDSELAMTCPFL